MAGDRDSLSMFIFRNNNLKETYFAAPLNNPANLSYFYPQNYSLIKTAYRQSAGSNNKLHYKSRDTKQKNFHAVSIRKYGDFHVKGLVNYKHTEENKISWNNAINTEKYYPFIYADSTTNTRFGEHYSFEAIISKSIKGINIGLEGRYHAQTIHGRQDPRLLGNVNSFFFKLGASKTHAKYLWGASVSYTNFKEQIGVSNYQDDRKDKFYFLKSFGQINNKYTNTERSLSYAFKGNELDFTIDISPLLQSGVLFMSQIQLPNYKMELGKIYPVLYEYFTSKFNLGYKLKQSKYDYTAFAYLETENRKITEQIFDKQIINETIQLSDYVFISRKQAFGAKRKNIGIKQVFSYKKRAQNLWYSKLNFGFQEQSQTYRSIRSEDLSQEHCHFYGEAAIYNKLLTKKLLIGWGLKLHYTQNINSSNNKDLSNFIYTNTHLRNYNYYKLNRKGFQFNGKLHFLELFKKPVFCEWMYGALDVGGKKEQYFTIAIGLNY